MKEELKKALEKAYEETQDPEEKQIFGDYLEKLEEKEK